MQLVTLELLKVSVLGITIKILYFDSFPLCFSELSLYIERHPARELTFFLWFLTYQLMGKTTELIQNPDFLLTPLVILGVLPITPNICFAANVYRKTMDLQ